jgi:type II secretory pathway component PulM
MRFLKRVIKAIGKFFARPFRYAAAEWNRISARERRLLSVLAGAFCGCAVLLVGYLVFDSSQSMRQANEDMREAIAMIAKHSDEYRDAKAKAQALQARIGTEPPQLAADLEAAAKEAGIQIPETVDRPPSPAGKHYIEHSLDVKLRKVDLKSLATFLGKVETGRALVLVTRLGIRRSFGGDGTTVDVDLTATTYERVKAGGKKAPAKGAAGGKGQG